MIIRKGCVFLRILEHPHCLEIQDIGAFSPEKTFECGQCFRFTPHPRGGYAGVAHGRWLRLWNGGDSLFMEAARGDFETIWLPYFDLNRNYQSIERQLCRDPLLRQAVEFGRGLRILAQDPWEALCSFILSQCCNIPRIRSMIDTLCRLFGDKIKTPDGAAFAFPRPEVLACQSPKSLAPVRAGYRAAYLLSAAQKVADGFDLYGLSSLPSESAREQLMTLDGVGRKVADCVLLFGLQKLDAFPVDTWMKKASSLWDDGFPSHLFGETAGIAQQYIFYFIRSRKPQKPTRK